MDSSFVIKVKYGDALRRFNVRVDENKRMDLDMVGLRAKICSIFNIAADANLILRYVDEDGDLVNLVDDNDLNEVTKQQLKFLKIDVHMINNSGGKSEADGSSGSATPLRSPAVSDPFGIGNFDALQALPEPVREALYSSFSKAASSNPVLANIADSISKLGISILKPHGNSHVAGATSSKFGVPDESVTHEAKGPQSPHADSASNASDNARTSGTSMPLRSPVSDPFKSGNVDQTGVSNSEPVALQEALSNLSLSQAASSSEAFRTFSDMISKKHPKSHRWVPLAGPSSKNDVPKELATPEARGPQYPYLNYVDSNGNRMAAYNASQLIRNSLAASNAGRQVDSRNVGVDLNIDLSDPYSSTNVNRAPLSSAVPVSDDKGKASIDDSSAGKDERCETSINSAVPNNIPTKSPALSFVAPNECPFSGTHTLHSMPPPLGNFRISPFKRSHGHTDAMNGMFHKGVRCDGCGVYPITGPRFKSKIKENYDLCSICINEIGNQTDDYIRMDRPASFRAPRCSYQNTKEFRHHPKIPPPIFKTGAFLKHARSKLDSRFILDVNVIDGTMMAPSTAFTKIWRMRNNGTIVWPKGTRLVWIGGDKLSDLLSVELEVPDDGVPMEKELDVAVDFRAPQLPGRYISYWRMASVSGHKFGQRVWVLIQVDDSLKDSFYDSSQGLNLNVPLGVGSSEGPRVIDINVQPNEDTVFHRSKNPNAPPEPVNQMVDEEQRQELGPVNTGRVTGIIEPDATIAFGFPTMETTFVRPAASSPANSVEPSSVSYPNIDFSAPDVPSYQQASTVDALPSSLGMNESDFAVGRNENDSVEEALLKELEEMGFKQFDLNKEVLRMNEYNLEQSIEELCSVSEWDPILEELHEMGFRDKETNKMLLKKNNGSIKRVVMDLINGE
ncbi:unnamed protein product [Trifolium pratense]|uniref:Uncharacterized protein n=1 Tax=Trifolium pratense TaxID=57577 RepID=A0ACB0L6M4_TRIPR|nr:unnamed protein product [Trifolium pratense]